MIIYPHSTSLPLLPVPWARPSRKQRYRSQAKRTKIWRKGENTICRGRGREWKDAGHRALAVIPVLEPPPTCPGHPRALAKATLVGATIAVPGLSQHTRKRTHEITRGHCEPHTTSSSLRRLSHGNSKRSHNTLVGTPRSAGIDVAIAQIAAMVAVIAHPRVAWLGLERLGRQGPKGMCG